MDGIRLLTLSGWTQPADALLALLPQADHFDYAGLNGFDAVSKAINTTDYDMVIGWSLGGVIARQLIQRGVLRAHALVLLSSPFRFVRNAHIHEAMPPDIFEQFYANYRDDTKRTVDRFHGLIAKGDMYAKRILNELSHHPFVMQTDVWLPWMDVLCEYNGFTQDYSMLPPSLIIHGQSDAIVPYEQSEYLHQHLPNSQHERWEHCGHAPHLHDPERLAERIRNFAMQTIGKI